MEQVKNSTITLISRDSLKIPIDEKSAKRTTFITEYNKDFPNSEIKLENIDGDTLKKEKEYLEHYKEENPKLIKKPLPKKDFEECVDKWDYNYINIDTEKIFNVMLAANFLNIESLVDLTCAKISSLIRGKKPEEIRRVLGMGKDFDELDENDENNNLEENLVN